MRLAEARGRQRPESHTRGHPHVPLGKMGPGRAGRADAFGVPVTGAVGADDAGEPPERADDLAAPPRLKVLHEQHLQVTHGCALRASSGFPTRRGPEKRGKGFAESRESRASARRAPRRS